jgi:serine/threonine protein kinase
VLQQGKDLSESDLIGRQVGNYRIKRLLGRGGMGAVFEMVHESIGQRSAIKILFSKYAQDPEFVERFFSEAKVVNRIEHPGVAKTLDHGQFPDGNLYIIMELLLGESLRARLETIAKKSSRYDLAAAVALILQLVDTLQEVHGKGVIHRDVKPAPVPSRNKNETGWGKRCEKPAGRSSNCLWMSSSFSGRTNRSVLRFSSE